MRKFFLSVALAVVALAVAVDDARARCGAFGRFFPGRAARVEA